MVVRFKTLSLLLMFSGFLFIALNSAVSAQEETLSPSEEQEKIFLQLAESLYMEGRYQQAIRTYRDFVDMYPDSRFIVRALEAMAVIYEKNQNFEEALKVYQFLYQRTGTQSNKGLGYYYNQARILNIMGEHQAAEEVYANIIAISPDSPYAKKAQIQNKLNILFEAP